MLVRCLAAILLLIAEICLEWLFSLPIIIFVANQTDGVTGCSATDKGGSYFL